jgi:pimeloyl-ACP methyl ester carboxylesterase
MQLHVEQSGSGPSVVFIHGWQNDTAVWAQIIDELQSDATCIAIDLPGHGRSVATDVGDYERDAILESLDEIVATCASPPVFVGHSLGGFLSLSYAATRPDTLHGLVLVATGPGYRSERPRADWNQWVQDHIDPQAPEGQHRICLQHDSLVIDSLPSIGVPTALVVGDRDVGYHAALAVFEDKMPDTTLHRIADAGHMVHAKKPAEVAVAIREVLAR